MRLIKKYQDFKSGKTQIKPDEEEKPHQKSDGEVKPERKSDKTPMPGPANVAVIPNWKTY